MRGNRLKKEQKTTKPFTVWSQQKYKPAATRRMYQPAGGVYCSGQLHRTLSLYPREICHQTQRVSRYAVATRVIA